MQPQPRQMQSMLPRFHSSSPSTLQNKTRREVHNTQLNAARASKPRRCPVKCDRHPVPQRELWLLAGLDAAGAASDSHCECRQSFTRCEGSAGHRCSMRPAKHPRPKIPNAAGAAGVTRTVDAVRAIHTHCLQGQRNCISAACTLPKRTSTNAAGTARLARTVVAIRAVHTHCLQEQHNCR